MAVALALALALARALALAGALAVALALAMAVAVAVTGALAVAGARALAVAKGARAAGEQALLDRALRRPGLLVEVVGITEYRYARNLAAAGRVRIYQDVASGRVWVASGKGGATT